MSNPSSSNIIIRLQNLPNEARAADIRRFFAGLNIPEGGVHVVGGEKGDAFINFSTDEDARQAMMKSGGIYGNQIKLFLSSRTEMQTVVAQARANPAAKPASNAIEPTYPSNTVEQQEQNGANLPKLPPANVLSSILAEFQAKMNQQQQLQAQHQTPVLDPTNALLLAAAQNSNNPLAIQQLLAALGEKQAQTAGQPYPFSMHTAGIMNNPYPQSQNGWMAQHYSNALQQQQRTANVALLLQQQQQSLYPHHNQDNSNHFQMIADEPYIRIRNIPVAFSYYNIKVLFPQCQLFLSDIKIINDQNGQRTGEIVLRLHTNKDVADLLTQDGRLQCFNSILDIKKIDEYTFASAIDSFVPAHVKKAPGATIKNCIRVTGLPKTFERKDVKRFFAGCNVTNRPGGIFIEADTINGPTFVEFETEIDAEKAFFYNGEQLGSSIIEMYRMTKIEMENEINSLKRGPDRPSRRPPLLSHEPIVGNIRAPNPNNFAATDAPFQRHPGTSFNTNSYSAQSHVKQEPFETCLRLRNIPYSTVKEHIIDYFAEISTPIEGCKMLCDRFNRGAGEALVLFRDSQSCQIAYEKRNRQMFHGRTLDLRPVSLMEYQNGVLSSQIMNHNDVQGSTMNQRVQQSHVKRHPTFYERDDERRNEKRPKWDGGQNKEGFGFNRNVARIAKDDQGQDAKTMDEKAPMNNHRSSTPPVPSGNTLPPLPAELNEYTSRILYLSNVAYRATREEILDFLRPYAPVPDTLKIRCGVHGKPIGFAVIACATTSDAERAVAELNNQTFMSRKIHLQQM